jgi:hypothetical protein
MNQKLLQANIKDASSSLCELLDIYSLTEERVARLKSLHNQIINEIDGIHDDMSEEINKRDLESCRLVTH